MVINHQILDHRLDFFRSRCMESGLAMTHQRWVIYRVLAATAEHPTPEEIFDEVRQEIPSISLATIYKNIRTFLEVGLLREVSTPHQAMRLDANLESHHHLVCATCGKILDVSRKSVAPVHLKAPLNGFRVESYHVNFLGYCSRCKPHSHTSS